MDFNIDSEASDDNSFNFSITTKIIIIVVLFLVIYFGYDFIIQYIEKRRKKCENGKCDKLCGKVLKHNHKHFCMR